jgi:ammonium transporter, Amt family
MQSTIDALWVLCSASLVFIMQAGFLCLEAGTTRRKNSINVALKNLADLGVSVMAFWAVGYGLMFGRSWIGVLGLDQFFPELTAGTGWPLIFFLFQAMFCSTSVTVLSGAIAERMTFKAYLLLAMIISGLIYPIFGHWAWAGILEKQSWGWLAQKGFVDFSGSTVVHSLAAWVSLAAILVVGPRLGRYSRKRQQMQMHRSDIPLASLGVFILWFGWFGFNGGSTLAFDQRVPGILLNTLFGGSAAMTAVLFWLMARGQVVAADQVLNSALAGLVAVTAGCHVLTVRDAIIVGAIGGLVMLALDHLLARWRIDDAVGAIPVHLGGGIWGTLAVGIFADPDRLNTGLTRLQQIQVQFGGVVAAAVWSFSTGLLALYAVNQITPLRVTRKQEYMGLNVTEHGAQSELQDLHDTMRSHAQRGNLQRRAMVNPFTEVGQISNWYNQVVQSLEVAIAQTDMIITNAVDGIMTVYPETLVIRTVNPAIALLFGEDDAVIVGRSLTDFISFDFYAAVARSPHASEIANPSMQLENSQAAMQLFSLIAAACRQGNVQEAQGFHRQGRIFPIEVTATESIAGQECFWTLMIRDATERKAAQTALQDSEADHYPTQTSSSAIDAGRKNEWPGPAGGRHYPRD